MEEERLVLKKQFFRNSLLAVIAYGRKPFVQIMPSAGLNGIAVVSTWDMSARQGIQKSTGSQAA